MSLSSFRSQCLLAFHQFAPTILRRRVVATKYRFGLTGGRPAVMVPDQSCYLRTSTVLQYERGKASSSQLVYVKDLQYIRTGARVPIPHGEQRHLKARRVKGGSEVSLFDGRGAVAKGLISDDFDFATVLEVSGAASSTPNDESDECRVWCSVTVCCCPPKSSSRADWMVEKLTELGVHDLLWIVAVRSELDTLPSPAKMQRWERLAVAASKQCMRLSIPEMKNMGKVSDIIGSMETYDLTLLLSPDGSPLLKACSDRFEERKKPKTVLVIAGPEGGFTSEEEGVLIGAGAVPVSLGKLRLRVETALLSAVSALAAFNQSRPS